MTVIRIIKFIQYFVHHFALQTIIYLVCQLCNETNLASGSSLVPYYWFCWCMYHSCVVNRRKVTTNQLKFIFTKQN